MSATLYEQFFAAGSVKSLLTGKKFNSPCPVQKTTEKPNAETDTPPKGKKQPACQ